MAELHGPISRVHYVSIPNWKQARIVELFSDAFFGQREDPEIFAVTRLNEEDSGTYQQKVVLLCNGKPLTKQAYHIFQAGQLMTSPLSFALLPERWGNYFLLERWKEWEVL